MTNPQQKIEALQEDLRREVEDCTDQILALRDELEYVTDFLAGQIDRVGKEEVIASARRTLEASRGVEVSDG